MTRYTIEEAKYILRLLSGRETGFTTQTQTRNAAHTILDHLAEEPEWEYGWKSHFPNGEEYEWLVCESREDAERQIRSNQDVEQVSGYEDDERLTYSLWKRTKSKAGPWLPVDN